MMLNFFARTYAVALFLVTYVNCDDAPTIIEFEPRGKVSANRFQNSPPFESAVNIDDEIFTSKDVNVIRKRIAFKGQKCRKVWHKHLKAWLEIETYLFKIFFRDNTKTYVWVDSKYGSQSEAQKVAKKITRSLGYLPEFLRRNVHVIAILKEGEGSNTDNNGGVMTWHENSFNSHGSFAEEAYLQAAAHISLDKALYHTNDWNDQVQADSGYISEYAASFPDSEDVAESFVAWFAVKVGRLSNSDNKKITKAIPNRLALFDKLYMNEDTDWYPEFGSKKSRTKHKTPGKKDWGSSYHCLEPEN